MDAPTSASSLWNANACRSVETRSEFFAGGGTARSSCLARSTLPGPSGGRRAAEGRGAWAFPACPRSPRRHLFGRLLSSSSNAHRRACPVRTQIQTESKATSICNIKSAAPSSSDDRVYQAVNWMPGVMVTARTLMAPCCPEFGWKSVTWPCSEPLRSTSDKSMPSKTRSVRRGIPTRERKVGKKSSDET